MPAHNPPEQSLPIAELAAGGGSGLLGFSPCPGRQEPGRQEGRDLARDLDALRGWGAAAVVSLIEDEEFALLRVEALGREVTARGMAWWHLPIRDMAVPDAGFEARWPALSRALHAHLSAGGRVLLHCRGGLGRSGTIAARLLVERGLDPPEAIRRVRAARPGAIETPAQQAHVLALRPGAVLAGRRRPAHHWP